MSIEHVRVTCPDCESIVYVPKHGLGSVFPCPVCARDLIVSAVTQTESEPIQGPPPPPSSRQEEGPKPKATAGRKAVRIFFIGCLCPLVGLFAILFVLNIVAVFMASDSTSGIQEHPTNPEPVRVPVEEELNHEFAAALNKNIQEVYQSFYFTGRPKNIVVHDVTIDEWKRGTPTNRRQDVVKCTARVTMYWEGDINKDGYTKIALTFDEEIGKYTSIEILDSNADQTMKQIDEVMRFLDRLFG